MKRLLTLLTILLAFTAAADAKERNEKELPIDPQLRYGKLRNGLTYYIRHNEEQKGHADFWLVQKTGSLVEEENERGLAHFLEHIAFSQTRHFTQNERNMYLQSNGINSGKNVNATTSFEDTRYYITEVPTARASLCDSVLLILRDIACDIVFSEGAINNERRVVEEEWRTGDNENKRMFSHVLPILMSGTRYANRMTIGDMSVIRNFEPQTLIDFYHRWYCPARQAIVIVGDIDAEAIEKMVRKRFGSIPACGDNAEVPIDTIPDTPGVTYAIYTDAETQGTVLGFFYKHAQPPMSLRNTMAGVRYIATTIVAQRILNDRLEEFARERECPYTQAIVNDDDFLATHHKKALTIYAMVKGGQVMQTFERLSQEMARINQHGFTQSELDGAKLEMVAMTKNLLAEKENNTNNSYCEEYITHFHEGYYIPGIAYEMPMLRRVVEEMTLDDVNRYVQSVITRDNLCVLATGPEGTGNYPTSRDIINRYGRIFSTPQEPYADLQASGDLLRQLPTPGRIISEQHDTTTNITTMRLSNGATVQLKPTRFRAEEVLFDAIARGGEWAFADTAGNEMRVMGDVIEDCDLGGHTAGERAKMLKGHQVFLQFMPGEPTQQFYGGCIPADTEMMLQLLYLYFTDAQPNAQAFDNVKSMLKTQISQASANPKTIFADSVGSTLYDGNPMYRHIPMQDIDKIDLNRIMALYRQLVANAGNYTFSFVGSFEVDSMRPLIERYIASLPNDGSRLPLDYVTQMTSDTRDNRFNVAMQTPKTKVYGALMGEMDYTPRNELYLDVVGSALSGTLYSLLRDEMHAIYDVNADGSLSMYQRRFMLCYEYETSPDACDSVLAATEFSMKYLLDGKIIDNEYLSHIKTSMRQKHDSDVLTNAYWLQALTQRAIGIDIISGYDDDFNSITVESIRDFIRRLKPDAYVRIIMQ